MSRNHPHLEPASLAHAVTTALRHSTVPLLTVEVIAAVAKIAGYGGRALPLVAVQVPRSLHNVPGVVMSGTRQHRLWAIIEID